MHISHVYGVGADQGVGALQILRGMLWSTQLYPIGVWKSCQNSLKNIDSGLWPHQTV